MAAIGASLVISGLSFLATRLLQPKVDSAIADKEPTTTARRGDVVPVIFGRARTGARVLWAGERGTKKEGGGGKGGGGDAGKQTIFYESGWHGIACGPVKAMHRIWSAGTVIFEESITPNSHPSGSVVDLGKEGRFRIYWGDVQPVDAYLAAAERVGVASTWPGLCYVVWDQKRLGGSPRWPVLEYEIECLPQATYTGGSAELGDTSGGSAPDDGVNPAHVIDTLLFAASPFGAGLDPELVDLASLAAVSEVAVAEHLALGFALRDGVTAEQALAQVMQDCGLFAPLRDGLVSFVPLRAPGPDQPILTEDHLLEPEPEIENPVGTRKVDAMSFSFGDRAIGFRDMVIDVSEDGQQTRTQVRRSRHVTIAVTPSLSVAATIADRRHQEEISGTAKFTLIANHEARTLYPGQVIRVTDIDFALRVVSVRPDAYSGRTEIIAAREVYGDPVAGFLPPPGSSGGGLPEPPAVDPGAGGRDVPPEVEARVGQGFTVGQSPRIVVPRIRASEDVIGADIYLSTDGSSFIYATDDRTIWGGGELEAAFPRGAMFLEEGPVVNAIGPTQDIEAAEDLTSRPEEWRLGLQIALIGREIVAVRNVEALGSGRYRLRGLLRARFGSVQEDHPSGRVAFVGSWGDLRRIESPLLAANRTVWVKTRPYNSRAAVDLASVTAFPIAIPDQIPAPPFGVRTPRYRGHAQVYDGDPGSGTVELRWSYRAAHYPRSGAGMQRAGERVAATSPPRGTFTVRISAEGNPRDLVVSGLTTPEATINTYDLATALEDIPEVIQVEVKETAGTGESAYSDPVSIRRFAP